jgi:CBS domain-containing protein
MVVAEIMSTDPFTADVTETVGQVMGKLFELDVRHLPIVENGALVGIVSDRDLRNFSAPALAQFEHPDQVAAALAQPISTVMSGDVVSVDAETELTDIIDLMLEHRIGAIPVVQAGSTRLVGIISYIDALRAAGEALAAE